MTEHPSAVFVVVIDSLSYTGTTWLNLVLASHADAFALGAPDRVWRLLRGAGSDFCRVHDGGCEFWTGFARTYDADANFYTQLAAYSGKRVIVINNPTPEHRKAELDSGNINIKTVRLFRDGRAVTLSHSRHVQSDFYDSVVEFTRPNLQRYLRQRFSDNVLHLRYEDVVADPQRQLDRINRFLPLEYSTDAFEFWRFDHHLTSGNAGTIAFLRYFQGLPVKNFRGREFYETQFECMRSGRADRFEDTRWQTELGRRELFQFDYYCGRLNLKLGYPEDAFTHSEREHFTRDLNERGRAWRSWYRDARHIAASVLDDVAITSDIFLLAYHCLGSRKWIIAGLLLWLASVAAAACFIHWFYS